MVKKAFIRTLEAIIAIVITFIFLAVILPMKETGIITKEEIRVLPNMIDDEEFRMKTFNLTINQCFDEEGTWIDMLVKKRLSSDYNYLFCVYDHLEFPLIESLPDKEIFVDSLFITKELDDYERRIVRFYYWIK